MKRLIVTYEPSSHRSGARCSIGRGAYDRPWPFKTDVVDVAMPWNHRTENDALKAAGDVVACGDAESATVWWSGDKKWTEVVTVKAKPAAATNTEGAK